MNRIHQVLIGIILSSFTMVNNSFAKNYLNSANSSNLQKPLKIYNKNSNIAINTTANVVFGTLINEISALNDYPALGISIYLNYIKSENNPWFAERLTQIAIDNKDIILAEKFAKLWQEINREDKIKAYPMYRTLSYIHNQLKNDEIDTYLQKWLNNIPKEKLNKEILSLPDIISNISPKTPKTSAALLNWLKNQDSWQAQLTQAKVLLKINQNEQAKSILQQLRQQKPNNTLILFTWLSSLTPEKQIEFLNDYIANFNQNNINTNFNSNDFENHNLKQAQMYLLTILLTNNKLEQGINNAVQFHEQNPADVDISFMLAQLYRLNKQLDLAEKTVTNLIEKGKNIPTSMYLFLADINNQEQKYDKVALWLEKIPNPDHLILQKIATNHLLAKNFTAAHKTYQILRTRVEPQKINEFEEIMLKIWLSNSQYQYAIENLSNLINTNKQNSDKSNYISDLNFRATLYILTKDFINAEKDLLKIDTITTDNIEKKNNKNSLAYLYALQNNNLDQAYALINEVIGTNPNSYAFQDTLGWVLYKMNKISEAKTALEKSMSLQENSTTATHLGEVLWKMNDVQSARKLWQKAYDLIKSRLNSNNLLEKTSVDQEKQELYETLQRLDPDFIIALTDQNNIINANKAQ